MSSGLISYFPLFWKDFCILDCMCNIAQEFLHPVLSSAARSVFMVRMLSYLSQFFLVALCSIYNYCQWNEWVNEHINHSSKTPALWVLHFYCKLFIHCSSLCFAVGLSKVDLWICGSIYLPAAAKSDFSSSYLLLIKILLLFALIYSSNVLSISLATMRHASTGPWLC